MDWSMLFRLWLSVQLFLALAGQMPAREPFPAAPHTMAAESVRENKQSMGQIMEWNDSLYALEDCDMVNLEELPEQLSGEAVRAWISAYSFPEHPLVNGSAVPDGYRQELENRRNLSGVPETVIPRFAVVTDYSAVRSFPTADRIQDTPDGFDYFQETGFPMGECVAVCHQTADGSWSFVRGEYYAGWIASENLAFAGREEVLSWLRRQKTGFDCAVALEFSYLGEHFVPMGNVLPIVRRGGDGYIIGVPQADKAGMLVWTEGTASYDSFHCGYLPLTRENLLWQGERCLGIPYGWGDTGGNPDCSSTVKAIYRCFGVRLPRNTSSQMAVPGTRYERSDIPAGQAAEWFASLPLGTFLYCPGHIMLAWGGNAEGEAQMLHNTTRYLEPTGTESVQAYRCVLTPLSIRNGAGVPYYEAIESVLVLPFAVR